MYVRSDTVQIAQKHYPCDACRAWLDSSYGEPDVTPDEWLSVQGADADKWRILPGQKYRKVVYIEDGEYGIYRGRLDMDAICLRHDLFEER